MDLRYGALVGTVIAALGILAGGGVFYFIFDGARLGEDDGEGQGGGDTPGICARPADPGARIAAALSSWQASQDGTANRSPKIMSPKVQRRRLEATN